MESRTRYEFSNGDDASSVASESRAAPQATGRKKSRKRPADDDGEGDDESMVNSDDDQEMDGRMVAAAAFGGGGAAAKRRCAALSSAASEDESITSHDVRQAQARAFPVTGVSCVGCALPGKIGPVDDFVSSNAPKMTQESLFKLAGLVYQQKVVDPAEAEGVPVPSWSWKDIKTHYCFHRVDARFQRMENVRVLSAMRKTLELSLMREDETGEVLDRGNSDAILKIISLQSKELALMGEAGTASSAKR